MKRYFWQHSDGSISSHNGTRIGRRWKCRDRSRRSPASALHCTDHFCN